MQSFDELKALDNATQGGLHQLSHVSTIMGLEPHIWVQPRAAPGVTRVIFYATDPNTGVIGYFDSALTPTDEELNAQILLSEKLRETKNRAAQIQAGLARLDEGLDPDYEEPDPARN